MELSSTRHHQLLRAHSKLSFGAMVRIALLTAQRREKVATMRWADISSDGEWTIPVEAREKGNARTLRLHDLGLAIIRAVPRLGDNPFVFAGRGKGSFSNFSKGKPAKVSPCTDFQRRTASCRRQHEVRIMRNPPDDTVNLPLGS